MDDPRTSKSHVPDLGKCSECGATATTVATVTEVPPDISITACVKLPFCGDCCKKSFFAERAFGQTATRLTLNAEALWILGLLPDFPKADEALIGPTHREVRLTYLGDVRTQMQAALNRAAANEGFVRQLAIKDHGSDAMGVAMEKWRKWLRHGLMEKAKATDQRTSKDVTFPPGGGRTAWKPWDK
jgi:hypothetical protein